MRWGLALISPLDGEGLGSTQGTWGHEALISLDERGETQFKISVHHQLEGVAHPRNPALASHQSRSIWAPCVAGRFLEKIRKVRRGHPSASGQESWQG